MPILELEKNIFPDNLLDGFSNPQDVAGVTDVQEAEAPEESTRNWLTVFTISRREKALARQLIARSVPFYLPLVAKDNSIRGRRVRSFVPVFTGYVFLYATELERVEALKTNHISQTLPVPSFEQPQLVADLCQVRRLIEMDAPLTIERRLAPGRAVRVKSGPMAGFEGTITARRGKTRLLVQVHFLQSGISVEIDDYLVDPVDLSP